MSEVHILVLTDSLGIADGNQSFKPGGYDGRRDVIAPLPPRLTFVSALARAVEGFTRRAVTVTLLARTGVSLASAHAELPFTLDYQSGKTRLAELDSNHDRYNLIFNFRGFNEGKDYNAAYARGLVSLLLASTPRDDVATVLRAAGEQGAAILAARNLICSVVSRDAVTLAAFESYADEDESTRPNWGANPFADTTAVFQGDARGVAAAILLHRALIRSPALLAMAAEPARFLPCGPEDMRVALAEQVGFALSMHPSATFVFAMPPTAPPAKSLLTGAFPPRVAAARFAVVRDAQRAVAAMHPRAVRTISAWPGDDLTPFASSPGEGDGLHLHSSEDDLRLLQQHFSRQLAAALPEWQAAASE